MAVGRITGPLLKANLLRDGVDLAFETDLLYIDVVHGRIGVKTQAPSYELDVVGTTRTTNLETTTQANIASFTIASNTISSSNSTINLTPSGANPVVYQGKLRTGNVQVSTNLIETLGTNTDLSISTTGTGQVQVNSNVLVNGNVHATGSITADGNLTLGDANTDNIVFNADINSNIIPNVNNSFNLGSNPSASGQEWANAYIHNVNSTNLTATSAVINGIELSQVQGNIYYVATTGSDTNAGRHQNNPFLTITKALSVATSTDTVYIYPGIYNEAFPLTVPAGVTVRGAGIRSVTIKPTSATRYNDAFLLNGETTVEDLAVMDFFSGGNYFTTTAVSTGSTTVNVGTAPFAHTYVSGGTIKIGASSYPITNAVYTHTTGVLVITHTGGLATLGQSVFVSNITFSCAGAVGTSTRVFPDNGYAFRFANNILVTTRSPYIRNVTVITRGSTTSGSDPYGFDAGDAGRGAYIDGAYANASSKEASMLFHAVTFITPNVDTITAKNGVRVEWLNSFTYFANKGFNLISSAYGFAMAGQTRLRINTRTGTWNVGNTLTYYDTDGTTVLASGTIASIDAVNNYVNLTGKCVGFESITDRAGKQVYANGNAQLSTAQKKFGTSSLALDGTGDFALVPSQADFNFGSGDFTIEGWFYKTASATNFFLFDMRTADASVAPVVYTNGTTLYYYTAGAIRITGTSVLPSLNTWYHIALTRQGTNTKLFVNGTQVGTTYTDSNVYVQSPITIGARWNVVAGQLWTGYIDDFRITKGVARYTSNFTAPTTALSGDVDTVLLLHFNGANGSTTFLDDGVTYQDLRTSAGGTATLINFADYSDFGAEVRAIGSACIYGNYGFYGNGDGIIAYLMSQNFAYVGAGKKSTNDPLDRIDANEVVKLNRAKIYYTSVDNEGNFSVGDAFYVNQKTGEVLFNGDSLNIASLTGVTFTDGTNTTTVTSTAIDTGNIRISGNTVETLSGNLNVTAASGTINLQNNTNVTGNLDVTGDVTIGGNITLGNQATDTINFVGGIASNILPATTATYNLGSSALRWNNVYLSRAEVDGLVIDNNQVATTLNNDDLTLTANGTGRIYIPSNNVQIDQNLTVDGTFTVTTGTSYLKNVTITGTVNQTGDYNITGNFDTTGSVSVVGNITGTGFVQLPDVRIENNTVSTTTTNTDLNLVANGTGNVVIEGLKIQDNIIQSTVTNSNIVLTPQGTGNVVINSNQSLQIPVGTTAERPATPAQGMVRYNTTLNRYEGWDGSYWISLGAIQDADGNTKIIAEATPGANDNTLYFYANGSLMATIDTTKLFAERLQTTKLDITTNSVTTINKIIATTGASGTGIPSLTTTGTSGSAGTATITFAPQVTAPFKVGQQITVAGILPSGYNGTYTVTGCTTSSVSYANATTGAQTAAGLVTTDQPWATLTFASQALAPFTVGQSIDVAGVTPTGYNGTYTVTYCTTTSVSYINSTTGNQTVAGTVSDIVNINLSASGTGGVRVGNFKIGNNQISNIVSGAITEFVESGTGYVKIGGTKGVVIPSGDTVNDRPLVPETGMIRFNTEQQLVEVYNGSVWGSVAGTSGGITAIEATDLAFGIVLTLG